MKKSLFKLFVCLILVQSSSVAISQAYPSKPIHFVVPYPVGGGADAAARATGDHLAKAMGQPVIIENKPGGNAIIGTQQLARATPDGSITPGVHAFEALNARSAVDQSFIKKGGCRALPTAAVSRR